MIEQRQYVDAAGRLRFLSRLMSLFVFDVFFQIPSEWKEICIQCFGPTSTLPGHGPTLFPSEFHINYIWNCLRNGRVSKICHANAASSSGLLGLQETEACVISCTKVVFDTLLIFSA